MADEALGSNQKNTDINQFCVETRYPLKDMIRAMVDRDECRERFMKSALDGGAENPRGFMAIVLNCGLK